MLTDDFLSDGSSFGDDLLGDEEDYCTKKSVSKKQKRKRSGGGAGGKKERKGSVKEGRKLQGKNRKVQAEGYGQEKEDPETDSLVTARVINPAVKETSSQAQARSNHEPCKRKRDALKSGSGFLDDGSDSEGVGLEEKPEREVKRRRR